MKDEGVKEPDVSTGSDFLHEKPKLLSPGARASTVSPGPWWNSIFRFASSLGGSFGAFLRSFHRRPARPCEVKATAALWPMPLPYPGALTNTSQDSEEDLSWKRCINMIVACLNWLHLRRPLCCPAEVCLFNRLSKLQWKAVKQMEASLAAWKHCEPITAEAMGRTAGKIEDLEALLSKLQVFEDSAVDFSVYLMHGTSGTTNSKQQFRGKFAPGLQRRSAGEICGALRQEAHVVAKPIVADRLDFRGVPNFDAAPFLDDRGRRIYLDPISEARDPQAAECDIPDVKIFASQIEKRKLLEKLDKTGRLGLIPEHLVFPGFQAGLFVVQKDASKDRLIFDSRPWNILETPPQRWIGSMASSTSLCDLQIDPNDICITSGTDLREFYYSFTASQERVIRNSLLESVWPSQVRPFSCYRPSFDSYPGKLFFGLKTLAMGDACAVELAQTAHVGILYQLGVLDSGNLCSMNLALPRGPSMIGIVIDDLVLFETISSSMLKDSLGNLNSLEILEASLNRYESLGLIPHPGKTFRAALEQEFWGCLFEGERGYVRASLKRTVPLLHITRGVLKMGVCTLHLLEILIGCWTSIFLFRRRLLSLLNVCYEALQRSEQNRKSVIRLSSDLKEELLLCCILAPMA